MLLLSVGIYLCETMADICIKLMKTLLFVNILTTQTQAAENGNPFDVTLSQSNPTHRISYDDAVATLDGSEPPVEMTWTIRTDENMRLQVAFHSFKLLKAYSVLMFGDGTQPVDDIYGVSYTKLAGFSDSDQPSTVISLTNSLWIRFRSHTTQTGWPYNFIMVVERIRSGGVDDLRLTSDNPTASIISPNYPNKYPNNSYRLWTVQAPVGSVINVTVEAFDLNSTSDNHHLLIGDTTDRFLNNGMTTWVRWTGKKPDDDVLGIFHYRSQGPSIYVLFTTSYKSGGTGFSLELRANFETPATTQPTTSAVAPSTTADIESSPPSCVCASTPPTAITNTTTEGASPGSHPVATDPLPTDMMGSAEEQRECPRNELFGFRIILVMVSVVLVLVFLSAAAGCYFQRRMNVNKLLITIDKKPDPRVRTQIWSAVQPVGKFDSDMSNALHEEADLVADIFPYGPILYGRPSSSCFSYKGRMDDFGYQLTETVEASSPGYGPALIHTYFDECLIPDRRIAEFKTYGKA